MRRIDFYKKELEKELKSKNKTVFDLTYQELNSYLKSYKEKKELQDHYVKLKK